MSQVHMFTTSLLSKDPRTFLILPLISYPILINFTKLEGALQSTLDH
jgi:hypothetical protein